MGLLSFLVEYFDSGNFSGFHTFFWNSEVRRTGPDDVLEEYIAPIVIFVIVFLNEGIALLMGLPESLLGGGIFRSKAYRLNKRSQIQARDERSQVRTKRRSKSRKDII